MRIFPKLQRHIDAALADPAPSPQASTEQEEDFAGEAKATTTTPKGGKK
jgi:hypothetical protein